MDLPTPSPVGGENRAERAAVPLHGSGERCRDRVRRMPEVLSVLVQVRVQVGG